MGWLSSVFGGKADRKPAVPSSPPSLSAATLQSGPATAGGAEPAATRKSRRELLRVVLRDTLNRHGIPAAWMAAEVLQSTTRDGAPGMHWRLVVRHWDPRLMVYGVAIQQNLIKRVMSFDPLASAWLTGISWQFSLPDDSVCPPMPHPGLWTQPPGQAAPGVVPPVAAAQASGDVISGPVRIPDAVRAVQGELDAEARADLEKLFAVRDADYNRASGSFEKTQTLPLATQPAGLR